jgi:2-isopropylmalate synthase
LLRDLLAVAVDEGAGRVCLCDTAGHATAHGAKELTTFARRELDALGAPAVGLDWHAHNDRGLAVSTALWAAASGADRIHGTALGIGERVGNASLELLVENLRRLGHRRGVSRASLAAYVTAASEVLAWRVPDGYAILEGLDADGG